MAEAVRSGRAVADIVEAEGVSRQAVFDACEEFGVPRTTRSRPAPRRTQPRILEVVAALLNTDSPYGAIADRMAISTHAVAQIAARARAAGIRVPKRPTGRPPKT